MFSHSAGVLHPFIAAVALEGELASPLSMTMFAQAQIGKNAIDSETEISDDSVDFSAS
jgi:hypothetical protein